MCKIKPSWQTFDETKTNVLDDNQMNVPIISLLPLEKNHQRVGLKRNPRKTIGKEISFFCMCVCVIMTFLAKDRSKGCRRETILGLARPSSKRYYFQ